jgi:hypothetical protein
MIAVCWIADVHHTLFLQPSSIHIWRQSDSASQFRNYYQNDIDFFRPQLHNLYGKDGRQVSEFPLTYYLAGKMARVFGFSEAWLRGLHLFLAMISLFLIWRMGCFLIRDEWLAMLPPLLLLTSPLFFYYAVNFLPNVPAIAMALIGWFFVFSLLKEGNWINWFWATSFMALAAIIRPSEGIHFVAACLLVGAWFLFGRSGRQYVEIETRKIRWLLPMSILLFSVIVASWIFYAKYFNDLYKNRMSLLGIYPIWGMDKKAILWTWEVLKSIWGPAFASPLISISTVLALLGLLFNKDSYREPLFWATALLFGGTSAYFLLWFNAFTVHDYYLLTTLAFPLFIWTSFFKVYRPKFDKKSWVAILLGVY